MTADIVNLNQFRKDRDKAAKKTRASENRAKFGRTKSEKLRDGKSIKDAERHLDGRKFSDDDQDSSS